MNIEEDAHKFIDKYMNIFLSKVRNGISGEFLGLMQEQAVECAIIDVSNTIEVLSQMKFIPVMEKDEFFSHIDIINYYEQVKELLKTK